LTAGLFARSVIPAKAGIQHERLVNTGPFWIPACAGMTGSEGRFSMRSLPDTSAKTTCPRRLNSYLYFYFPSLISFSSGSGLHLQQPRHKPLIKHAIPALLRISASPFGITAIPQGLSFLCKSFVFNA